MRLGSGWPQVRRVPCWMTTESVPISMTSSRRACASSRVGNGPISTTGLPSRYSTDDGCPFRSGGPSCRERPCWRPAPPPHPSLRVPAIGWQRFGATLQVGTAAQFADTQVVAGFVHDDVVLAIALERHVAAVGSYCPASSLPRTWPQMVPWCRSARCRTWPSWGCASVQPPACARPRPVLLTARQGEHRHYHSQFTHACTSVSKGRILACCALAEA